MIYVYGIPYRCTLWRSLRHYDHDSLHWKPWSLTLWLAILQRRLHWRLHYAPQVKQKISKCALWTMTVCFLVTAVQLYGQVICVSVFDILNWHTFVIRWRHEKETIWICFKMTTWEWSHLDCISSFNNTYLWLQMSVTMAISRVNAT